MYLTVVGLLGVGLGFLIRNTAGAIATLFGLLLVLPAIVAALPNNLVNDIDKFLPLLAGTQILTTVRDSNVLSPGPASACSPCTPWRPSPAAR